MTAAVSGWHVAPSLNALQAQYDARFPNRPRGTDGALGNASHSAKPSDHNPDYSAPGARRGVVRARDCSTTLVTAADKKAGRKSLTEAEQRAVIADLLATEYKNSVDRIRYIIHRFPGEAHTRIWSRTYKDADGGWTPKVYNLEASSPHDHHFHVSIMPTAAAENDVKPWFTAKPPTPPTPPRPPVVKETEFDFLSWNIGINLPKAPQAKIIKASGATVIALQECGKAEAAALQDILGPSWVWTRSGTRTVMWRKDIWKGGDERTRPLPAKYSKADKSIAMVELTHIKNKDHFWPCSTHFSANVYDGVTGERIHLERVEQANATVKALKPYFWCLLGADLNSSSPLPGAPRDILAKGGWTFLTGVIAPPVTVAGIAALRAPAKGIDDILAKPGVTILGGEEIPAIPASDHNAWLARCRINAQKPERDLT